MFSKIVEYFINSNHHELTYQRYLDLLFVRIVLVIIFFIDVTWILHSTGVFMNEAPYLFLNIFSFLSLFIYKFTGRLALAANILAAIVFLVIILVIDETGGIYSYNLRWFMMVIFFSFLFSNAKSNNNSLPFSFIFLSVAIIIYYYYCDTNNNRDYLEDKAKFTNLDYMIDNLSFIFTISGLAYFFHRSQKKITELVINNTVKLAKTSKKLKDSNRSLESYAYATSHDMKQPVRTIISFTQLLEREIGTENLSEDALTYMNYIKSGTNRISELIDGVLDFSTINNAEQNQIKSININRILIDIEKDLLKQFNDANGTLSYNDLPNIYANELQLKRVFLNLISNALKFKSADKPLQIKIDSFENETHFHFSVEDNGKGIPSEKLEYIFEPFKRLDFTEKGSGIGLATCKKIVQMHNGEIWAESIEGKGACFNFTIEKQLQPET